MRMNIYVQDELAEQVKQVSDINVSAVCQAALRNELVRQEHLRELDNGMERVELYVERPYESEVAFQATPLGTDDQADLTVYLTKHHRFAVYDGNRQELTQYDTFNELQEEVADPDSAWTKMISMVAGKLGEKHIVELDI